MMSSACILLLLSGNSLSAVGELTGPNDLRKAFYDIFPTGNRNAASHKWATYVLDRASGMTAATMKNVFKGFCPVSGSPIGDDPRTLYKVKLPTVNGDVMEGVTHHCCWPCVCDLSDFIRVDTKTVTTADGPQQFNMLVLGDPCKFAEKLDQMYTDPFSGQSTSLHTSAPELACKKDGSKSLLDGAIYSDHGYPIIGLFFTDHADLSEVPTPPMPVKADDPTFGYGKMCLNRRTNGYNSGMGLIFHLLAGINPIPIKALPLPGEKLSNLQQKSVLHPKPVLAEPSAHASTAIHFGLVLIVTLVAAVAAFTWRFCRRDSGAAQKRQDSPAAFELSNFEVLE